MPKITMTRRAASMVGLLLLSVATILSAHTGQQAAPERNAQMDQLLAEVRAIRADLDRAAAASLRGQLLGMRLQLQEQRITALSRQLSEVQNRLSANAQARSSLANSLKFFGGQTENASGEERKQMEMIFAPLKGQLAALDKADADLKQEQSALLAQLQDEQNRWSAFNGQVEELERASSGRQVR